MQRVGGGGSQDFCFLNIVYSWPPQQTLIPYLGHGVHLVEHTGAVNNPRGIDDHFAIVHRDRHQGCRNQRLIRLRDKHPILEVPAQLSGMGVTAGLNPINRPAATEVWSKIIPVCQLGPAETMPLNDRKTAANRALRTKRRARKLLRIGKYPKRTFPICQIYVPSKTFLGNYFRTNQAP